MPGQLPKTSRLRLALTIGGVLVLVVVAVVAILGFNRQEVPAWLAWLQRYTRTLPATSPLSPALPSLQPPPLSHHRYASLYPGHLRPNRLIRQYAPSHHQILSLGDQRL